MVRFKVEQQVTTKFDPLKSDGWQLAFQWGWYVDQIDGSCRPGYRFIWLRGGKMQPTRGQARLPSLRLIRELIDQAESEGWGGHDGDRIDPPDHVTQAKAKPAGLRGVRVRGGPVSDTVIEGRR